jgi:hypothetical protein
MTCSKTVLVISLDASECVEEKNVRSRKKVCTFLPKSFTEREVKRNLVKDPI